MRRTLITLTLTMTVVACGVAPDAGVTTTGATSTTTTTTAATSTTFGVTTTTTPATTTTSLSTTTTLAGQPVDLGPADGDVLMVMGVAHDDVLNLRTGPGVGQSILDGIEPTYMGLIAAGETRQLPGSFWTKVDHAGTTGWVNLRYVGYSGDVADVTAQVVAELGSNPSASSMTELGMLVAEAMSGEATSPAIVQVNPVTTGDLGEVSFDVVGLDDDAVTGVRLHVFGEPDDGGFTLKTVEMMAICGRGVDEGACV
ncbi:MAG: hypothetical protein L0Z63_01465 [Actinobacteria bacterium]|nr:hypothetical protein [Actinomycetota bacterium]